MYVLTWHILDDKRHDVPLAVKEILRLCPTEKLMSIYKVPQFSNEDEFLLNVATVRGKLKKGGVGDSVAAARMVLHDWNEGPFPSAYSTVSSL